MSLRNITTGIKNNDIFVNSVNCINCNSDILDCKTMGCDEVFATNLYTRNDDTSITRLNQPNNGINNQVLKTNGDGTVYWGDSLGETYTKLLHGNLSYDNVTGISTFNDQGLICSKNGNMRHISGEIDVKLEFVNGRSFFYVEFDRPYGENRQNLTRTYGNAIGYAQNNAFLFNAISVYNNSATDRIKMLIETVNRTNWTQNVIMVVRVMYNLNYIV